jgi:ubiquinone/menaquinone biosynthesis C-methylase UbiE
MAIYEEFAEIYSRGSYGDFSGKMAEALPQVLEHLKFRPSTILDVACGDGTFAVAAAAKGYRVTGLDISKHMLACARKKVADLGVDVDLVLGDMRALDFAGVFDLATCWFDSLNYLVDPADLASTFRGVWRALMTGGLFVFDMNTIYGLAVNWRECGVWIQSDDDSVFEVHRSGYDFETNLAVMRITGFIRDGNRWRRVDETHRERAYSQVEIRQYLVDAGFQVVGCWGNLKEMSEATPESGRIWYVAKQVPAGIANEGAENT